MFKKYFFIAALMSIAACSVQAQDADITQKRKLIAEILAVQMDGFNEKKLIEQLEPMMRRQFEASIAPSTGHLTSQQRTRITDVFVKVMREDLTGYFETALPSVNTAVESMYLKRMNTAELFELHRFTTSDLGKKQAKMTLEDFPQLIEPIMQASAQLGQRMGPKLAAEFLKLESEGIRLKQP